MSLDKFSPSQRFYYLQTGVILQRCVILLLRKFELGGYEVMLHFRGVKLHTGLKTLRCNLTHFVFSDVISRRIRRLCLRFSNALWLCILEIDQLNQA